MALNDRLHRFFTERGIACAVMPHREAFTAKEVATATHVAERELAKVVVVRGEGGGHLMVVLPPACRIDLKAVRHATGRRQLALAAEAELGQLFPDCEMGNAAFGNFRDCRHVDGASRGQSSSRRGTPEVHLPYGSTTADDACRGEFTLSTQGRRRLRRP